MVKPIEKKTEKIKGKQEQILLKYIGNANPKGSWEDSFIADATHFILYPTGLVRQARLDNCSRNKITPRACSDAQKIIEKHVLPMRSDLTPQLFPKHWRKRRLRSLMTNEEPK